MVRWLLGRVSLAGLMAAGLVVVADPGREGPVRAAATIIALPKPALKGAASIEEALAARRSVREFTSDPLTATQVSQLLWAAQGITHGEGHRTAPSAGALYPLEIYLARADGVYHYLPQRHALEPVSDRDLRREIHRAALWQDAIRDAPATLVIAAVYARTEARYGKARAPRYIHMEAGHAAQNVLLQAAAIGLGGVPIGAFDDAELQRVLGLASDHRPIYLIPVGRPRGGP